MPSLVNVFGTFRWTRDQPDKNPGMLFWHTADIFLNITDHEIKHQGMLIVRKIGQLSLVGGTYDWHDRRSGRELILYIPLPIARVHLAVDSTTLGVSEVHQFKIGVLLKWETCQKALDAFDNIPVEYYSEVI